MARKSKGKFNMKGHSVPGIKGFKGTSLEDGRAASSAFQMKESPLHEKLESGLDWTKEEKGKDKDKYLSRSKLAGESGASYAIRQAMRLFHEAKDRRKKKKDKEENPSKVHEETTTKYDEDVETSDIGTYDEYVADVGEDEGTLSEEQWNELNEENITTTTDEMADAGIAAQDESNYELDEETGKYVYVGPESESETTTDDELMEKHDTKLNDLITAAQSGLGTKEGSAAFMDLKKMYPEKSNEEITTIIERGKI